MKRKKNAAIVYIAFDLLSLFSFQLGTDNGKAVINMQTLTQKRFNEAIEKIR